MSTTFDPQKAGGGVIIAVHKRINSHRVLEFESGCEDMWIVLDIKDKNKNNCKLYICGVYLAPPMKKHILDHYIQNTNRVLENLENVILVGDFNLSCISWTLNTENYTCSPGTNNSSFGNELVDFSVSNNLYQYNHVLNVNNNILDLVFSNLPIINLCAGSDSFVPIDPLHPSLLFSVSFVKDSTLIPKPQLKLNFYKADYNVINSKIESVPWANKFSLCKNIDDMVDVFYNEINDIVKNHVPQSKIAGSSKYPPWFTNTLIKILREKHKLHIKVKRYGNPMDKLSFELLRARCDKLRKENFNNYISKIEESVISNSKLFWSYIKQKRQNKSTYPAEMKMGTKVAKTGDDICNLFADNFSKAYSRFNPQSRDDSINQHSSNNCITTASFNYSEVFLALKRLDHAKGAGADGLPAIFVKNCARALSYPLQLIYNASLQSGVFPTVWKEARVIPLFKAGDKSSVTDYRPISILSVVAKVFEKLIHKILFYHVRPLLSNSQHGFMKARSTCTNMVDFVDEVSQAVDSRISTSAIYTDFSKAFDRVNYSILLGKLESLGVGGSLLSWLGSYLHGRNSKVVINGYSSYSFEAVSGVPQGSHLGPLLFNVFINDLPLCFQHTTFYLFADDLKIVKPILSLESNDELQSDLSRLVEWCDVNGMPLNTSKCYHMMFSRCRQNCIPHTYYIKYSPLKNVVEIRDLGMALDSKLQFNKHVECIVNRGFKMLGFIIRNTKDFKSVSARLVLFNSLVRSCLEYCSPVWNPHYAVYEKRIESVQKRFLWHLSYRYGLAKKLQSYKERLEYFHMQSLSLRRKVADIIFLHKLVNGLIDAPTLLAKLQIAIPVRLPRKNKYLLFHIKKSNTNLGQFSPLNRMCRSFNSIAKGTDICISQRLPVFKKELMRLLQSQVQSSILF